MVMLTMLREDKPSEWDEFQTPGEILGMVNKQLGLDGGRQILKNAGDEYCAEYLQMVSAELLAAGLKQVAAVVDEFAADAPSALDLRYCTYSRANAANIWAWERRQNRIITAWDKKRKAFLRRAAINSR
jgi:hypothetical protein